jgi:hypothetical protein
VVGDAPAPYARQDDVAAGTGPADVEQVIRTDVEGPAARQLLTDAGLTRAFTRRWLAGGPDEALDVELYQYRAHAGAVADMGRAERIVPALAAAQGLSWTTFAVPTVPGARGYAIVARDGSAGVEVVTLTRGPYAAVVTVASSRPIAARATAIATAEAQRARLSRAERVEVLVTDGFSKIRR